MYVYVWLCTALLAGIVAAVLLYGGNPDVYDSALRIRNATMLVRAYASD